MIPYPHSSLKNIVFIVLMMLHLYLIPLKTVHKCTTTALCMQLGYLHVQATSEDYCFLCMRIAIWISHIAAIGYV